MTDCNKEKYPTFWEKTKDSAWNLAFIQTANAVGFSEQMRYLFVTFNAQRRVNLLPDRGEGSPSPDDVWMAEFKLIATSENTYDVISDIVNSYRKYASAPQTVVTEKDFPAPNGVPNTAYVDNMRESTFQDRPPTPEELEKILSIPSAWEIYNRIFDPLFVGVL